MLRRLIFFGTDQRKPGGLKLLRGDCEMLNLLRGYSDVERWLRWSSNNLTLNRFSLGNSILFIVCKTFALSSLTSKRLAKFSCSAAHTQTLYPVMICAFECMSALEKSGQFPWLWSLQKTAVRCKTGWKRSRFVFRTSRKREQGGEIWNKWKKKKKRGRGQPASLCYLYGRVHTLYACMMHPHTCTHISMHMHIDMYQHTSTL